MNKKFILIIFIFLVNLYYVNAAIGDELDCDDNNVNIFPGAIEICNDNIDNNCNQDNSDSFDINPTTGVDLNDVSCCNLLSAQWSAIRTGIGNSVTLTVTGTIACEGESVSFVVKEDDQDPLPDNNVNINPQDSIFQGTTATTNWIAEDQNDGIGDPEYYFIATTQFDSQKSSDPKLIVGENVPECGDGNLDQTESCFTCPADAGCNIGEACLNVADNWACVGLSGPSICGNGQLELGETCKTCAQDLPSGFCDVCINNNVCDVGENCLCGECNGQQGSCIQGNVCNEQGVCIVDPNDQQCTRDLTAKAQDPECCEITKANWALGRATTNSLVELIVEGNEYCENRIVNFEVFEDEVGDDLYVPPDPISRTIVNQKAESTWSVANVDDGFFQGQPEFYFIVNSAISSLKSNLLEIITCGENDADCDGVKDENDKCPDTPLGEIENVDSSGCAPGEASCVAEWDCTNVEWTECNEEGYRTRDINKCVYSGNNLLCESKFKPSTRQSCLVEEAFPIFTTSSLIFTLLILLSYYFIILRKKH
jgi:hypothetical protein